MLGRARHGRCSVGSDGSCEDGGGPSLVDLGVGHMDCAWPRWALLIMCRMRPGVRSIADLLALSVARALACSIAWAPCKYGGRWFAGALITRAGSCPSVSGSLGGVAGRPYVGTPTRVDKHAQKFMLHTRDGKQFAIVFGSPQKQSFDALLIVE
eukprot:3762633-Pyramimonas_sp.AAC.1